VLFAKAMRWAATDAEKALRQLLGHRRLERFKFRRQVAFEGYILDLVCFDRKIAIETDGSQHFESKRDEKQ